MDELTVTVLAGTVPAGTVPLGTAPGDPDGSDLISLHAWLTQSAETRGLPVVLRRREPGPGAMPGVDLVDALVTTVSDKAVMAAVASGVAGWVTAHMSTRRIRLRIRRGEREIEVDTASARNLDELADWIRRQLADESSETDS